MPPLPWISARWKPLRRYTRAFRSYLPDLNFITIHYIYFLTTTLIAAIILWGSATPHHSLSFTDSLFLAVSAMTEAGLNTVNLSTLNTFQQIVLFVLIMIGSAIFVSAFTVHIRRRAFDHRFTSEFEKQKLENNHKDDTAIRQGVRLRTTSSLPNLNDEVHPLESYHHDPLHHDSVVPAQPGATEEPSRNVQPEKSLSSTPSPTLVNRTRNGASFAPGTSVYLNQSQNSRNRITFSSDTRFPTTRTEAMPSPLRRVLSFSGVGARPPGMPYRSLTMHNDLHRRSNVSLRTEGSQDTAAPISVTRNSNFQNLTEADRVRLGGKEYKAVGFLAWIVPLYFVLWQLLGCLGIGAFVNHYYASTARMNGLNPWWVGAFNAVSAFNNSGMSLLDANMVAFNRAVYILITMGLLILAGNTCFPIFLRLIVWSFYRLMPAGEMWNDYRETLKFLLDHPRRCYTNLFPAEHTWWLLFSVIALNGVDCAAYAILNIGNTAITNFPNGIEFLDGLFQAFAVRSGGFYVVPISSVRVSLQVLYVVMMYISAFPVTITMRNSNVYEERSLGIYSDDLGYDAFEKEVGTAIDWFKKRFKPQSQAATEGYFVQQQLRAQLAHDLWWLVLAIFLIMIVEGGQFERNPSVFSVFNVIFEVVSGYGTVGISVGLPNEAYSFCGAWHTLSKLILCAVMLRGRHRGLPVAIDKAVLLPNEHLHDLEEEVAHIRAERRSFHEDRMSQYPTTSPQHADALP